MPLLPTDDRFLLIDTQAFRTLRLIDGVYEQMRRYPDIMRLEPTPETFASVQFQAYQHERIGL